MMRLVERAIALATGTTVSLDVPHGSAEHLIRLEESVAWRFGSDQALVAGGVACPWPPAMRSRSSPPSLSGDGPS